MEKQIGSIESIDIPIPPRSAREKIESEIRAETESPKNALDLNRREFLKASAIAGSLALLASSGLVGEGTQVAEAASQVPGYK